MEKKQISEKEKQNSVDKEQISKKKKSKKIFAALGKKQIIAMGVTVIIAIAVISGGGVIYANMPKGGTFIYGTFVPIEFDPLNVWSARSIEAIDQVAEGLLNYDPTSDNNDIIPNLATNWEWSSDGKQITFTLRQGVTFHDGTVFDATAAKWNFDRIQTMLDEMEPGILWLLPDGRPIIKQTVVVDTYTLRLELNDVYVPLLGLLASWTAYMLSPTSTPADRFLENTEDLVGTGPFTYDSYELLVELKMSPNPNYWGGKPAIDELIFLEFSDDDALGEAMMSGDVSMILYLLTPSMIETFRNTQGITVQEGPPSTTIYYLGMNNNLIPVEMRKAISYALNYSYVIEELLSGYAERCRSPIPKGILYSNTVDFDVPDYDVQTARQALKEAGWPGTADLTANNDISPGNEWEKLVTDGTPLETYNYTLPMPSWSFREDLLILLTDNLKQIGVEVEAAVMTYFEFGYRAKELSGLHRDMLQLFFWGWEPDYNDPSTFINPLFTNKAVASNGAQVNDAQVQQWMDEALTETDPIAREQLYYNIQERLIEEVYPWCWLFVDKNIDVYVSNLRGWHPNSMKIVFKTVYFV